MIHFLTSPTFVPPQPPVPLGANGTVLTVVGGTLQFAAGGTGGGVTLTNYVNFVLVGAGPFNNLAPTGFSVVSPLTGRLDLSNAGASVAITGLTAGTDGQIVLLRNSGTVNNITLNLLNAGSTAANQFTGTTGPGDPILTPGNPIWLVYYAQGINKWVVVP